MKKILILVAVSFELKEILKKFSSYKKQGNIYEIPNKDKLIIFFKIGIGLINAKRNANYAIAKFNPDVVINMGVAGALNNTFNIGDIVVCNQFLYENNMRKIQLVKDYSAKLINQYFPSINIRGTILSVIRGVGSQNTKNYLKNIAKADLVDMESGVLAEICTTKEIPFFAIKCISDYADDLTGMDEKFFGDYGKVQYFKLFVSLLVNPIAIVKKSIAMRNNMKLALQTGSSIFVNSIIVKD